MRQLKRVLATEEIDQRVEELGASISDYYKSTPDLLVIGLLKGSFIFLVGYGLGLGEQFRHLPYIAAVEGN